MSSDIASMPVPTQDRRQATLTDLSGARSPSADQYDACILGLGYVGLPTALSLTYQDRTVLGIDISDRRLSAIVTGDVDVLTSEKERLDAALTSGRLQLTTDPSRLAQADAVFICVPTPIDRYLVPDLSLLRRACELVVSHARAGQVIILTSTTYVGTTSDLLADPLRLRGFEPGLDIHVAFSPERIDPGNSTHPQHLVPRVAGLVHPRSRARIQEVLRVIAPTVHFVSSAEAAEMTKLYENAFRAVNIAFALEMSQAAAALGISVMEVIDAAATKPYGFMPFYPGPGVGGHCIPCDPHYLLWQLREQRVELPMIERAMATIAARPKVVTQRLRELLSDQGIPIGGARILLVGAAYKPGVRDTRESPAIQLCRQLVAAGAALTLWDPVARTLDLEDGRVLTSVRHPAADEFDAAVVHTVHPGVDHTWLVEIPVLLDATYRLGDAPGRAVV